MSVPIAVIIHDPEHLQRILAEEEFFNLLDEGRIEEEELYSDELEVQMVLLQCYERFQERLPDTTRAAFESFVNTVFWSWREDEGNQRIDIRLDAEELDSSFLPGACEELASCCERIDWEEMEDAFLSDEVFESFSDFRLYLDDWKRLLDKARSSGNALFVFVFP